MTDDAREHERLAAWLRDDLAEVDDPAWQAGLRAILDPNGRSIREVFVDTFLSREGVREATRAMADPDLRARRLLAYREALPTLDAMVLMAPDPRPPVERAAALAHAALALDLDAGGAALGRTQVPGEDLDRVVLARPSGDLAVLCDGRPYLIARAAQRAPRDLRDALAWIVADAPTRPASTPLRALTAASRPACHALREALLRSPDNARALEALEGARLVLCLDTDRATSSSESLCGLFSRRPNRLFGASQLVVDADARAALIESYTRGHDGSAASTFARDARDRSRHVSWADGPGAAPESLVTPLSLHCDDDDPAFARADAEAARAFHREDPVRSLDVDRAWFKTARLSPNAALQVLLLLAADDLWREPTAPALTFAARRPHGTPALDWLVAPTHGLTALRDALDRDAPEALERFRAQCEQVQRRVERGREGPSPSLLVRSPEGPLHERLLAYYLRLGAEVDSGYRAYLFRAARTPGAIDLITSTLVVPDGVDWIGRPGGTSRVASKLGLHLLPRERSIDLVYIPNEGRSDALAPFHQRLEARLAQLRRRAERER